MGAWVKCYYKSLPYICLVEPSQVSIGSEITDIEFAMRTAFADVSLNGVSVAYYEPDRVLLELQSLGKSWEEIPRSYFEFLGSDSIWLAEGRKFQYVLPSALLHVIKEVYSSNSLCDLGETLISRLLNMARSRVGSPDFHTRRILTIFQSKMIFVYLQVVTRLDHPMTEEAVEAIDLFWGRFELC